MPTSPLLQTIQERMPELSKNQRRIAAFILERPDKAAFMTAGKIGAAVGTSESTVVRFAAELGYAGYPQMQKALQELLRGRLSSLQRMEVVGKSNGDPAHRSVLLSDIENMRQTLESFREEDFYGAVEAVRHARSIYIVGARSSAALASFLAFYLRLMFPDVRLVGAAEESSMLEQLLRVGPEDVVVGISFPRYSHRTVNCLKFSRERGAVVVALTDRPDSPSALLASHLLTAPSNMVSFVDSLVSPMSLLNAFIVAVGARKKEEVLSVFTELEDIWERYEVFEK